MKRLIVLLAAVLVSLALVAGMALAQPRDETNGTAPPGGQAGVLAGEAEPSRVPQGPSGFRVDYDPDGNPYVAGELLVTYEERVSARAADAVNEDAGANVEAELPEIDAAALSFPDVKGRQDRGAREAALADEKRRLEGDPSVESVSYNYLQEALSNDGFFDLQWNLPMIKAPEAWATTRGANVKIAVVDSGIENSHPDLVGSVIFEHDYVEGDAVAQPGTTHGTHVAGIAAARADNGTGIAGVAPNAQLMDYKVLGGDGRGSIANIVQAITDSANAGAHVINLSLGGPNPVPEYENAVNFAWNKGAVVVAAAGNSAENGNPVFYPAAYPNTIAVGSVNRAGTRSNFSEFGAFVDVAAPGGSSAFGSPPEDDILSTVPHHFYGFGPCVDNPDCYDYSDGTSMAAPHVAGVAALLKSRGLTNAQVRQRIESTATDLGPAGRDDEYGLGLVNAQAAVTSVPPSNPTGKVAFHSNRDGNDEVYVMNADGSAQTRLTNNPAGDSHPALSPDGARIAFGSNRDGDYEIFMMNTNGSGQTQLTNNATGDGDAAFSPNGARIVFGSSRDGNSEVYAMNADGSGQSRLTNNAAWDGYATFSPDGRKITFVSSRNDGNGDIFVMNADGSAQTRLTTSAAFEGHPAFSPDGSKIAFSTNRGNEGWELYAMNADGTNQTRLTNTHTNVSDDLPVYSPDGSRIAFTSNRDGNPEIYSMNADGSGTPTRLTNNPALDAKPSWGGADNSGGAGDTAAPKVTRVVPAENATGIAPTANAVAVFSEPMRTATVNANTVRLRKVGTTTNVPAAVGYDPATRRATLNPSASLQLGATYVATVTSGTRDLAGNPLDQDPNLAGNQAKSWRFTVRP